MKYLYSLFFLFLFLIPVKSQTVTYLYDESGNRKTRNENTLKNQLTNMDVNTLTFGLEVQAYPNPTDSYLTVVVSDADKYQANVQLFSLIGELVYEIKAISEELKINMISYPSGIYFLQVTSNGKTYLRKIIKK
jgi:hypothetical protein